jgi:putative acetyltransferase
MIELIRTDSGDANFRKMVLELDKDLRVRDGDEHAFFAQYNKIDKIRHVIVALFDGSPAGCGAIKEYEPGTAEVKRMYTEPPFRGKGVATAVLNALEEWAAELGYTRCILETGKRQPEAIALYHKNRYRVIPNYGQYRNVETSVCFEKNIPV